MAFSDLFQPKAFHDPMTAALPGARSHGWAEQSCRSLPRPRSSSPGEGSSYARGSHEAHRRHSSPLLRFVPENKPLQPQSTRERNYLLNSYEAKFSQQAFSVLKFKCKRITIAEMLKDDLLKKESEQEREKLIRKYIPNYHPSSSRFVTAPNKLSWSM